MIKILELTAVIAFLAGFGGMFFIFCKKTPILFNLPKTTPVFKDKNHGLRFLWLKIKEKIGNIPVFKNFSLEILLQKTLSRFRVFALKIENKTGSWLESLRKRAQENNDANGAQKKNDDYWKNLQKKKE